MGGLKPASLEEISKAVETSGEQGLAGKGLVEKTQEPLSPWVAPSPGQGTGPHRYCFALYKETKPLLPMSEQPTVNDNERSARRCFQVAEFAKQNGLELVGFNYFLVSRAVRAEIICQRLLTFRVSNSARTLR